MSSTWWRNLVGRSSSTSVRSGKSRKPRRSQLALEPLETRMLLHASINWLNRNDSSFDDAFASGRFNRVPVIEGATHDEFRLFVPLFFDFATGPVTPELYPIALAALLAVPPERVPAIVAEYPLANFSSPGVAAAAAATDKIFACNMHTAARLLSAHTPTWVYEFNDANAPQLAYFHQA